jgi:DNA-binding transcriptional MerR regulator
MYRRKDVEYVMQIRKLLYEDGFTIAGAREKLREESRSNRAQSPALSDAAIHPAEAPSTNAPQPVLPFIAPAKAAQGTEELRRVRQQLREVLGLLS